MSNIDPVAATIHAYDHGASDFVARNRNADLSRLFAEMEKHLPIGGLMIDVGAGPGWHSLEWMRRGYRAVALDLSAGMLREARALGVRSAALADMRRLPLPARCADGLWVCASLLHIPRAEASATLREFNRVLKPDGAIYLGVKGGEGERFTYPLDGLPRYFVFWREDEIEAALQDAGFEVVGGWVNEPEEKATRADPWINRFGVKKG